jgi:hypothetical protein
MVPDYGHMGKVRIRGILLVLLLVCPASANAEESTTTTGEKNSGVHQTTKTDSSLTFSDVMKWVQRFGNRVGENISEAASKTASAIRNATTDNKQESPSEDSP